MRLSILISSSLLGVAMAIPSFKTQAVTVLTCTEPHLQGDCTTVDAWNKCSANFASGSIKSISQAQGAVCRYYRDGGCQAGNHVPSKRGDSLGREWKWEDMGEWAGKVLSFKCGYRAQMQQEARSDSGFGAEEDARAATEPQPIQSTDVLPVSTGQTADRPGLVTFCTAPSFGGECRLYDPLSTCLEYPVGWVRSVIQDQGALCVYFQGRHCTVGGGTIPAVQVDSRPTKVGWRDMGEWSGKVISVNCRLNE